MLAGVLLHVIETALPIDPALHFFGIDGSGQHMRDALAFVDHILYGYAGDGTCVERLPTRGRIERGAIQIDSGAAGRSLHHAGPKLREVRISVVQAFGHTDPTFPASI